MKKNIFISIGKYLYLIAFLLLELIIYISFMYDDFVKDILKNNSLVKYESIILINIFSITCFIIELITERVHHSYDKNTRLDTIFTVIALMFTLLSDTFLLYLDKWYELGVSCFIVVQMSYFLRLIISSGFTKRRTLISSIIRGSLFIVLLVIMAVIKMFNFLYVVTMFYFINLVMNFIDSFISAVNLRKDKVRFKSALVFSLGLLLFIGCDINVGLSNLIGEGSKLIWAFYLPSQILILISSLKFYNFRINGVALHE